MKLITRDTDYAVRALCYIAKHKQLVSVKELVDKLKIPRSFLRKILQKLNKNGLLKSYKGKGGGFALNGRIDKILLTDLIDIFQGPIRINNHLFKRNSCPHIKGCRLKKKLDFIETVLVSELKNITIASLLK